MGSMPFILETPPFDPQCVSNTPIGLLHYNRLKRNYNCLVSMQIFMQGVMARKGTKSILTYSTPRKRLQMERISVRCKRLSPGNQVAKRKIISLFLLILQREKERRRRERKKEKE